MKRSCATLLFFVLASPLWADAQITRAGVVYSPFLPVVTAGVQLRMEDTEWLSWGAAFGGFYALGRSVHAELFLEPVYLRTERWRVSSRAGLLLGWHEQFPVGPPPEQFPGPGVHFVPVEAMVEWGGYYLGALAGVKLVTDFNRVAGSFYLGLTAGLVMESPDP